MTDQEFWELVFISVLSFRTHPRNDDQGSFQVKVDTAAKYADDALIRRNTRWDGSVQR